MNIDEINMSLTSVINKLQIIKDSNEENQLLIKESIILINHLQEKLLVNNKIKIDPLDSLCPGGTWGEEDI